MRSTRGAQRRARGASRIHLPRLGIWFDQHRLYHLLRGDPCRLYAFTCATLLGRSVGRIYLSALAGQPRGYAIDMPSVRSTLLRRIQSVRRCYGPTASRGAASVTCVDRCSASASPTVPPLVWLQPFCSPLSLLLCGCLFVESAPHRAIHLLRLG